jgi:hypothetical protein
VIKVGQTTIFNFVKSKKTKEYIVIEKLPQFVDTDLSYRGPYKKGDIIRKGDVTDRMLEILLERGVILPKE